MSSNNISAPTENARITAYEDITTSAYAPSTVRTKTAIYYTAVNVFAASRASALFGLRATARLLGLDNDTVNRMILRAGEHCARVLAFRPADVTAINRNSARRAVDLCKKKESSNEPGDLEKQYGQTCI